MYDPYLYPNSNILKNKFGVKNEKDLNEMEAEYTSLRLKQLAENPLKGDYGFMHFCDFHKYIFQDIYEWAGLLRIINIEKEEPALGGLSIEYADNFDIPVLANSVLSQMKNTEWEKLSLIDRAGVFSDYIAKLWKIHAFREGNTRTVVTFMCQYAESRGFTLDRSLFENNSAYMRTSLVAAAAIFHDMGDKSKPEYLKKIILDSMQKGELIKPSIKSVMEIAKQKSAEQGFKSKMESPKGKEEII